MKKDIPIASQTFGEGGEHLRMPPEISDGIYVCYDYFEELDTPANKAFLDAFRAKFGTSYGYISDLGMSEYLGVRLWAEGVKKAKSVDRAKVIKALEFGHQPRRPGRQDDDRAEDAPLYFRHAHRPDEEPQVRTSAVVQAGTADQSWRCVRSGQEP